MIQKCYAEIFEVFIFFILQGIRVKIFASITFLYPFEINQCEQMWLDLIGSFLKLD